MRKSVGWVVAVFAVAGVLVGSHAAAEDGVTADAVVIGAYGPLTGPAAYIGLGGRDVMAGILALFVKPIKRMLARA